ncbi:hypothetical protein VT84_13755 [Gemmata sp. SH-PL17]|uniref:hypothetical protein n=1 Tax=Gemmata sp. SH-PL17 TaxID=1630693 RepID=UPI00078EAF70|nr:hypothetical protein [Gemmata sp. SH-PL17]AMV25458.1 hypothetical protein VT84_13755 [Gemmata sp. SH-PL17]
MSLMVAKKASKAAKASEKRGRGRPQSEVPSTSFSCRAPLTLVAAFMAMAKVTGTKHRGTELLKAAEKFMVEQYWTIKDNRESKLIQSQHVGDFLEAAEAYFKEAGRWPLVRPMF